MRSVRAMTALRLATILLPLMLAPRAWAQGFQLERYEPTPAGESFFAVEHPWYSSVRWFAGGLTFDYAHDPLVAVPANGGTTAVIEHQLALHIDLAASFLDRVLVETSLPFTIYEAGGQAVGGVAAMFGAAPGDPRIGVFVRLYGHAERDPLAVSVGGHLWIPVGEQGNLTGDDNVRGEPVVTLGGSALHHLAWAFNAGVLVRGGARLSKLSTVTTGHELRLGAAIAWTDREQNLQVGPELSFGSLLTNGRAFSSAGSSLEILAGLKYTVLDQVQLGVAAGLGTLREVGTPDARAIFRIAYAPRRKQAAPVPAVVAPPPKPVDRDGDGVPDSEDACPDKAGVRSDDPAKNGCPAVADRDHDGVPDDKDQCPDEPAGATPNPEKPGCPDKDSDGDGVLDSKDVCPDKPAGAHPDSRQPGCPAEDSDLDGVYDDVDACPDKPGLPNKDPAKNGCPLPDRDNDGIPDEMDACPDRPGVADPDAKRNGCPRVKIQKGEMTVLQPVFFATREDTILPQSFPLLQTIASSLVAQPHLKKISIEGHADDRGTKAFNQDLSERRAASVMKFLIEHGVAAERLESHGFGSNRPVTPRRDEESRARNRRVEFRILQRDPGP